MKTKLKALSILVLEDSCADFILNQKMLITSSISMKALIKLPVFQRPAIHSKPYNQSNDKY